MNDLRTRHVAAFSRVGRFCLMSAALAAAAAALGSTCVFGSPAYAYADDAALPAGGASSPALAASPDGDAADAGSDGVSGTADGSPDAAAPGVAEDASSPTGDTPGVDASPAPAPAPSETPAADASAAPASGEGSGFPDAAPAAPEGDPSTPGWHDVEGGRIYVMPDGTKASGKAEVDGEIHYFDPETNLERPLVCFQRRRIGEERLVQGRRGRWRMVLLGIDRSQPHRLAGGRRRLVLPA